MKQFKILGTELKPNPTGAGAGLKPSKFIIKFLFENFNDPVNTMKLLLYRADDHKHYGKLTNPKVINPIAGSNVNMQNNFAVGNLEIVTSQLLKAPPNPNNDYFFDHLVLTPDTTMVSPDVNPQLIFEVKAYDGDGNEVHSSPIKVLSIDDGNPCPPKTPAN